jgi:hypothetical protein
VRKRIGPPFLISIFPKLFLSATIHRQEFWPRNLICAYFPKICNGVGIVVTTQESPSIGLCIKNEKFRAGKLGAGSDADIIGDRKLVHYQWAGIKTTL